MILYLRCCLGGIFSPLPSELHGNLYAINKPDELVLGYISACTQILSERVFIPDGLMKKAVWEEHGCDELYPPVHKDDIASALLYFDKSLVPTDFVPVPHSTNLDHVAWHIPRCVDCRELGGTKTKPT